MHIKYVITFFFVITLINTTSAQQWEFNDPGNTEGWLAYNGDALNENINVQNDGLLIIDPIGPDPWIRHDGLSVDSSSVDIIKIRMSSNCNDKTGAIYFTTSESKDYDENKKFDFTVSQGLEWNEYTILVSDNPSWSGFITGLRIDPSDYADNDPEIHDDTFGFDYIRLEKFSEYENNDAITDKQKQQEIFNLVNIHKGELPAELVLAIICQEGGKGSFYTDGSKYNTFYEENHGPWAQPTNGDGIMQVTPASGYDKSKPYTEDNLGYDYAINDGCAYLNDLYEKSNSPVYATLHYNSGPNTLYIYLGKQQGDPNYLSKVADDLDGFVSNTYSIKNQNLVDSLNKGQAILNLYLYNKGIEMNRDVNYYRDFQSQLDDEINNIEIIQLNSDSINPISIETLESSSSPMTETALSQNTGYWIEDQRIEEAIKWAESEIEVKTYNYNLECLKFVEDAFKMSAGSRLSYAKNAANKLNAESNKGLPPRGAFVFYDWDGKVGGVYKNWGHVGLSLGNGEIIHNSGTSILKQDYRSLDSKKFPYIGWAYPPLSPPINRRFVLSGKMDGNDRDITGIFDSSTSEFTFNSKSVQFGLPTDIPIIGNWDGKGGDEIGVFRPVDDDGKSRFYLVMKDWNSLGSKVEASEDIRKINFGIYPTDIPVVGDWDNNGRDDVGGFNPENNEFYLYILNLDSSVSEPYGEIPSVKFGISGDIPFVGDWDGNGKDEIGVFRYPSPKNLNTNAFYFDSDLSGGQHEIGPVGTDGKILPYEYGDRGDYPVIGDWDGDGDDDIGVYRPVIQEFYTDINIPKNPGQIDDINGDGRIDVVDISTFVSKYGAKEGDSQYDTFTDINGDSVIDISDALEIAKYKIMELLGMM